MQNKERWVSLFSCISGCWESEWQFLKSNSISTSTKISTSTSTNFTQHIHQHIYRTQEDDVGFVRTIYYWDPLQILKIWTSGDLLGQRLHGEGGCPFDRTCHDIALQIKSVIHFFMGRFSPCIPFSAEYSWVSLISLAFWQNIGLSTIYI